MKSFPAKGRSSPLANTQAPRRARAEKIPNQPLSRIAITTRFLGFSSEENLVDEASKTEHKGCVGDQLVSLHRSNQTMGNL